MRRLYSRNLSAVLRVTCSIFVFNYWMLLNNYSQRLWECRVAGLTAGWLCCQLCPRQQARAVCTPAPPHPQPDGASHALGTSWGPRIHTLRLRFPRLFSLLLLACSPVRSDSKDQGILSLLSVEQAQRSPKPVNWWMGVNHFCPSWNHRTGRSSKRLFVLSPATPPGGVSIQAPPPAGTPHLLRQAFSGLLQRACFWRPNPNLWLQISPFLVLCVREQKRLLSSFTSPHLSHVLRPSFPPDTHANRRALVRSQGESRNYINPQMVSSVPWQCGPWLQRPIPLRRPEENTFPRRNTVRFLYQFWAFS